MRDRLHIAAYPQQDWSNAARYGWAVALTLVAFVSVLLLLLVGTTPIYAPLVAAVAIAAWLGGVGPALLALALGWTLALILVVPPVGSPAFGAAADMTRWSVNLVVGLAIVVIAALLEYERRRAAERLSEATSSLARVEALQALSAELARASTTIDVSRGLSRNAGALVGADGAVVAVSDGQSLVLIEPTGLAARMNIPGRRLPLEGRTLLAAAVSRREPTRVDSRALLAETFPDSMSTWPPSVQSALALPLVIGDEVVGAAEFLFERANAIEGEGTALAAAAAGLAAQALDRARLYEEERASRASLERVLEVAPRFHAEAESEVTEAICREARAAFRADFGVLWRIADGKLVLLCSHPSRPEWPPGIEVPLSDFPGLDRAVATLGVSFVPDVLTEARREGYERVRQLGIRSSLRTPIVIAGSTELVLVVSWQTVVPEPDPSTLALARRFADQAGLAFEQLERRRAEARAAVRADETTRLQEVTAALSAAATRSEVGDTCLEHALRFVGAETGFVVLTSEAGTSVQFISHAGLTEDALAAWQALDLGSNVPFARAIATGEPVWAFAREEMDTFTDVPALEDAGWITIPLKTPASVHGALHVSLAAPLELDAEQRSWLQSVVSQCALALERSHLYEREQQLRLQSERLRRMTERLANALTPRDVAEVVVEAAVEVVGASAAALYELDDDGAVGGQLAAVSERAGDGDPRSNGGLEPFIARAALEGSWIDVDVAAGDGAARRISVPLVSSRRAIGVLDLVREGTGLLSDDDRGSLVSLAGQAAQALDRARRLEAERSVAEALQRSVLPVSLPSVPGVQLAARYLPGTRMLDVGGDWFDAMELHDGRLGLVVGDVVGKGVHAAANMGQLRNALRALAFERLKPPSALQRLDRLSAGALDTTFATVLYAIVDREACALRYASAGHPPPIVAYPDGRVLALEDGRGLPLGTGLGPRYRQGVVELFDGSMVILYSDGLVERRGRSIDEGIDRLRAAVREGPTEAGPLLEHILERLLGRAERGDDIAIIAARVSPVAPRPLDLRVVAEQRSLGLIRSTLRIWLEGTPLATGDSEEVLLGAWELCANAIEHAENPRDTTVRLRARVADGSVHVAVEDTGSFVPPTTRLDRGLGLKLAGALSSSFEVTPTEGGTRVTLVRALPDAPAD